MTTAQDDGEILTVTEAAALARVHPVTLSRAIHENRLPAARFGTTYRIRRADLLAMFATGNDDQANEGEAQ